MDFKVAGTVDGITAIQMDIKVQGITIEIMREAMTGARNRGCSSSTSSRKRSPEPRTELSSYAPRMIVLTIDPEKIKDVIGPGGKIINKIIADTGVKIDIENDGRVFIASPDGAGAEKAKQMVEALTKDVKVGETYLGTVTRLMNFGAFVAVLPGKEGLVHISQLAPNRVEQRRGRRQDRRSDHGQGHRDRLARPHQPVAQGRTRRRRPERRLHGERARQRGAAARPGGRPGRPTAPPAALTARR